MLDRNKDLREAKGNIPAWMIGEKLNCHENTIYRLFRSNLSNQKKAAIMSAINEIKQEFEKAN
jgi:hypothetical protein